MRFRSKGAPCKQLLILKGVKHLSRTKFIIAKRKNLGGVVRLDSCHPSSSVLYWSALVLYRFGYVSVGMRM